MSVMLGSSRRNARARVRVRVEGDQIALVERPAGPIRLWIVRSLARLLTLFGPPVRRA
jgi:hypothetical protein